jgi:hypothetical protein
MCYRKIDSQASVSEQRSLYTFREVRRSVRNSGTKQSGDEMMRTCIHHDSDRSMHPGIRQYDLCDTPIQLAASSLASTVSRERIAVCKMLMRMLLRARLERKGLARLCTRQRIHARQSTVSGTAHQSEHSRLEPGSALLASCQAVVSLQPQRGSRADVDLNADDSACLHSRARTRWEEKAAVRIQRSVLVGWRK